MGLNPITLHGRETNGRPRKVGLSLGRLHIGSNGKMEKLVSGVLWEEREDGEVERTLGTVVWDEDHVVKGLKLLFPNGELAT